MDPKELSAEIEKMTIAQRLILTQDIWDSIAREDERLPMPEWQKQELEKRYRQYREGNLELHDWQDVHYRLRGKKR